MQGIMNFLSRIGDKAGVLGSLISAMGCAACFPAMSSIAAALGLGFLSHWEGLFINTLLPVFAAIALAANILGWFSHRQYVRTTLGVSGPAMVLSTLFPLWEYEWSTSLLYTGIGLMLVTSLWDLFAPANRRCANGACEIPQKKDCTTTHTLT